MVAKVGVEPTRNFFHWILSPAHLPVTPLSHLVDLSIALPTTFNKGEFNLLNCSVVRQELESCFIG